MRLLFEKSVGSCGCGATFFAKKCRVFVVVWAQGPFHFSCDVLDEPLVKKGEITRVGGGGSLSSKKKDGEINARARALDTKRLAGITFSYHLPSNHDSIHFVAESSREDAFGKVLRAFRGG